MPLAVKVPSNVNAPVALPPVLPLSDGLDQQRGNFVAKLIPVPFPEEDPLAFSVPLQRAYPFIPLSAWLHIIILPMRLSP